MHRTSFAKESYRFAAILNGYAGSLPLAAGSRFENFATLVGRQKLGRQALSFHSRISGAIFEVDKSHACSRHVLDVRREQAAMQLKQ
jgi:hypothetical protein